MIKTLWAAGCGAMFCLAASSSMAQSAASPVVAQPSLAVQTEPAMPGSVPGMTPSTVPGSPQANGLVSKNNRLPGDAYWPSQSYGGTPNAPASVSAPNSVDGVMADAVLRDRKEAGGQIPEVRAQALTDAASAYGVQAGMANRANELNAEIRARASKYDRAFSFAALMLEPGFLPPVISEGRDAYNQPSSNEVRAADRIYRIEFAARLVNVSPTWRDYLFVQASGGQLPSASALPKTGAEKELWNQSAAQGWSRGVMLANQTFEDNLARLRRDYSGMLRYKLLYQQGLVSKPILARSQLGNTGGGDEMAIGDRIYRITDKAQLIPDGKRWSTAMPVTAQPDFGTGAAPVKAPPQDISGKDRAQGQ